MPQKVFLKFEDQNIFFIIIKEFSDSKKFPHHCKINIFIVLLGN